MIDLKIKLASRAEIILLTASGNTAEQVAEQYNNIDQPYPSIP